MFVCECCGRYLVGNGTRVTSSSLNIRVVWFNVLEENTVIVSLLFSQQVDTAFSFAVLVTNAVQSLFITYNANTVK